MIRAEVLTDRPTIAGFTCDAVGNHGETFFSEPFVWSKGKLIRLPLLPKSEYGAVLGGNDQILIGWSSVDYDERPVSWRPHPRLGWSKATITQLAKRGQATHLGPDGSIYIRYGNPLSGRVSKGKFTSISLGEFALQGIDTAGRLYGYKYKGWNMRIPADMQPGFFTGKSWTPFKLGLDSRGEPVHAMISAVNPDGVAAGSYDGQFALWRNGNLVQPDIGKPIRSDGQAISANGDVVGYAEYPGPVYTRFLWSKGKVQILSEAVTGHKLDSAQKINRKGDIAASVRSDNGMKLYLLRRR